MVYDGVLVDWDVFLMVVECIIRVEGLVVMFDVIVVVVGVMKSILYRGVGDKDALV